ncbi:MAG: hypothetical protein FWE76_09075, partial [Symbiobacteriaceae bacterium]|nr:hypothetical protein [Symbiobacteriaceae bacterium]
ITFMGEAPTLITFQGDAPTQMIFTGNVPSQITFEGDPPTLIIFEGDAPPELIIYQGDAPEIVMTADGTFTTNTDPTEDEPSDSDPVETSAGEVSEIPQEQEELMEFTDNVPLAAIVEGETSEPDEIETPPDTVDQDITIEFDFSDVPLSDLTPPEFIEFTEAPPPLTGMPNTGVADMIDMFASGLLLATFMAAAVASSIRRMKERELLE